MKRFLLFVCRLISFNFRLKLLSLAFALIAWGVASWEKDTWGNNEHQLFVPVLYKNVDPGTSFKEEPMDSLQVVVVNETGRLENVHPSKFQVTVDLKDVEPGTWEFVIDEDKVSAPEGIEILRIIPRVLSVDLEASLVRDLEVRPSFSSILPEGLAIRQLAVEPDFVTVKGSRSKIEKLRFLETRKIDLGQKTEDFESRARLIVPDFAEVLNHDIAEPVKVRVKIGGETLNVRFDGVPVKLVNNLYEARANPEKVNLLLYGERRVIESIDKEELTAYVDLAAYVPGNYKIRPEINLAQPVEARQIWPLVDVWVIDRKKRATP